MTHYVQYKWGRAKKTVVKGKAYDSKFEASYAQELELRKRAGEIQDFATHKRIPLVVNGFHVCDYYIDFVVYHHDGMVEYVETKGIKTAAWVLKWKIFEATYGQDPINTLTLVQQKKFRLRKIKKIGGIEL